MRTELGLFIADLVKRRGFKLHQVAEAIGMRRQDLNDALGDRWNFKPEYAIKIAAVIGDDPVVIMLKWLEIEKAKLADWQIYSEDNEVA